MSMLIRRDEHNIDKLFRQKLHDVEEETPLHLWEGIRQKTQKKRRGFYWFMFAALMVGMIATAVWFNQEPPALAETHAVASTGDQINKDKNANTEIELNRSTVEASAIESSENKAEGKTSVSETTQNAEQLKKESSANKPNPTTGTNRDPDENNTVATAKKSSEPKSVSIDSKDKKQDQKSRQKTFDPSLSKNDKSTVTPSTSEQKVTSISRIQSFENTETPIQPPFAESRLAKLEEDILKDDHVPLAIAHGDLQEKSTPYMPWKAGLYAIVTAPFHSESKGHNPEQIDALLSRTKTQPGAGIGVGLFYQLQTGFTFGASLEAYSFSEKHSWQDTSGYAGYFQQITYEEVYTNPDSTPIIVAVTDTVYQESYNITTRNTTNVYSSINVPLLLGWQKQHNKINYGLEIGPVFRLQRGYKGSFVFPAADLVPLTEVSSTPPNIENFSEIGNIQPDTYVSLRDYYTLWKTDIHIGINFGYALKPNLNVDLGLFYRQSTQIIDKGSALAHRMVQPGMRLGLFYRF